MAGHLFVLHSDLTRLRCDHWLLPSDGALTVSDSWRSAPTWTERGLESALQRARDKTPDGWESEVLRSFPLEVEGAGRPWVTNVGGELPRTGGQPDVRWHVEGARQFLVAATGSAPMLERARPLLALPIVGTGQGGARAAAGDLLLPLVRMCLEHVTHHDVDVALVSFDAADFAAAQAARRSAGGQGIDPWASLTS